MFSIRGVSKLFLKITVSALFATIFAFISIDSLPGDVATVLSGTTGDTQILREQLGLNTSIFKRFFIWIHYILQGDFGTSAVFGLSVREIVGDRILITMPLAIMSLILSIIFGVFSAVVSLVYKDTFIQRITHFFVSVLLAVPMVWLGLFFITTLSVSLDVLPSGGYDDFTSYIMPILTLGLTQGAITSRYVFSALKTIENKDFIHFARVRGASKMGAYIWHGLPAVAGSLLAIMGLQVGFLMTGVVVVESIFSMPGLGDLLYQAMTLRDIPVSATVIGFLVFVIICVNAFVDIVAYAITPALRKGYNA